MFDFLIIYSTTDGHTKIICERIKNSLNNGNLVELLSLEDAKKVDLSNFKKISGIGVLINTSFNMHEEPIICTINDAFRAFISSKLDYLMINDEIFRRIK